MINMNGRVYDPLLGRMLSPDTTTTSNDNTESKVDFNNGSRIGGTLVVAHRIIINVPGDFNTSKEAKISGGGDFKAEFYTKTGLGGSADFELFGLQLGVGVDIISKKRSITYDGNKVVLSNFKISSLSINLLFAGGSLEYDYTNGILSGEFIIGTMVLGTNGYSNRIFGDIGIIGQVGAQIDFYPTSIDKNYFGPICPVDHTKLVQINDL